MTRARIFQEAKNAMQSGRARTRRWVLEFVPVEGQRADPLMGWAGSGDTLRQVRLTFASLDEARAYATRHGIDADIVATPVHRPIYQAYADNFR